MRKWTSSLSSFGLGASAAFLLDPASGKRRRHRIANAAVHLAHQIKRLTTAVARDLNNRTRGILATAPRWVVREHVDDVVLEERVHSALGHVIKHPHTITVKIHEGHVTLDGPMGSAEANRVLSAVRAVRGVKEIDTRFDRHIQPAHDPSSEVNAMRDRTLAGPDIVRRQWAPAARIIVGASGVALVSAGLARRDQTGAGLIIAGAALLARAAAHVPFRRFPDARARTREQERATRTRTGAAQA